MMEKSVKLGHVVAATVWTVSVLLMLTGTIVAFMGDHWRLPLVLYGHALLVMGAAATLTVRNLFERQNRLLHDAFSMGQETAAVRRVR